MMKHLILALALAVAGCASTSGGTSANAERTVFAAKSAYATALTAAVAYRRLPACASPRVLPCHEPAVLTQIQKADTTAAAALDAAETAVRTPQIGTTARERAVSAANAALASLSALLSSIGATP